VQDRVSPVRVDPGLVGPLPVIHHHADLCAKMLLVVAEGLRTFTGEIHISIHLHCCSDRQLSLRKPSGKSQREVKARE
jgi:hypothetical protein